MNKEDFVITLTFGDVAENHVGMEQIGNMVDINQGFNLDDLKQIKKTFTKLNIKFINFTNFIQN